MGNLTQHKQWHDSFSDQYRMSDHRSDAQLLMLTFDLAAVGRLLTPLSIGELFDLGRTGTVG